MGLYLLIEVLLIIICIIMVLVVLVQNSKGGGLVSSFSSSAQVMGVRKTADFLEKMTWGLAVAMLVLSLFSFMAIPKGGAKATVDTELRGKIGSNQPVNYNSNANNQQQQQQQQQKK